MKEENPEWFDEDFYEKIYRASKKAYAAECNIVDWIFEKGDLDFISALSVKEYIKKRFNKSMEMIGGDPVFEVDETLLEETNWFDPEVIGEVNTDFFHKRPTSYSRKTQSYTAEDLF